MVYSKSKLNVFTDKSWKKLKRERLTFLCLIRSKTLDMRKVWQKKRCSFPSLPSCSSSCTFALSLLPVSSFLCSWLTEKVSFSTFYVYYTVSLLICQSPSTHTANSHILMDIKAVVGAQKKGNCLIMVERSKPCRKFDFSRGLDS